MLSAAWYQLAADASPGIVERRRGRSSEGPSWPQVDGLTREQEIRVMGALHDVAAALAHCARACREGRSTVGRSSPGAWPPDKPGSKRQGNDFLVRQA